MIRRHFLASAAALLAAPALRLSAQEPGGSLLDVARATAARPYQPNTTPLPPPFADLTYDAFRGIRPIPGKAAMLPVGPDYAVDLLPPGLYFPDPVMFELVGADGAIRTVPFSPDAFTFEPRYFDEIPETAPGAGYTGLRLRHPLNTADVMDEFMVMQGASYFRAIGRAMGYGLSARAVALGTGGPGPEEFPRFTQVRLHPPDAEGARIEAVIDGPSLAGYMDLHVKPGNDTEMHIEMTLLPRTEIADVGIAPLTSMFLKGPLRAATSDDFRPRVHDSDVLFIENGSGERIWRPIANPAQIETSAFGDVNPRGFGLFQTERDFEAFQDAEANYHGRPSAMVRTARRLGTGRRGPGRNLDRRRVHGQHRRLLASGGAARGRKRASVRLRPDLDDGTAAPGSTGADPAIAKRARTRPAGHAALRHRLLGQRRGIGAGNRRGRRGRRGFGGEPDATAR